MAKKTVKKIKKEEPEQNLDLDIDNLLVDVNYLKAKIAAIHVRIDNVIDAHERCKTLKGL